ncbi:MAG: DUF3467 domain-containing protein [Patescibacteria group bacterium]|jgi:hypothetical protein|nr:DUF3467 domain-containing protein [Patescibacteria group bacterium]
MQNQQPQPNKQIKLADNIPGAEYANIMQVSHTKEEFMLMFANIAGPSGRVVSKVITSPGHMKRIVAALQENLKKYEDSFGQIEKADSPNTEMGFGARD